MKKYEREPAPGIYEHYKGMHYKVIGVGRHTESEESYVVYTPLYDADGQPEFWLRPYEMFVGDVEVEGKTRPRFKKIG